MPQCLKTEVGYSFKVYSHPSEANAIFFLGCWVWMVIDRNNDTSDYTFAFAVCNYTIRKYHDFISRREISRLLFPKFVIFRMRNSFFLGFTCKYVHAFDMESQDLLMHLEDCLFFIDEGCKSGGVFVHWLVKLCQFRKRNTGIQAIVVLNQCTCTSILLCDDLFAVLPGGQEVQQLLLLIS